MSHVGAAACLASHGEVGAVAGIHGHAQALKHIDGRAPDCPAPGTRAGVPLAPAGKIWNHVSHVIGGHVRGALFVGGDGLVMSDGVEGVNTHWNLDFPPTGATAGFVPYESDRLEPMPFDRDTCFGCPTTGPQPQDAADPCSQGGRPGIRGT